MPDWTILSFVLTLAVGGSVGFLSGLFGVGGGFLLVPILNVLLAVPMALAVGSTACYTLGPATVAVMARKPARGFIELPLIISGGLLAGVYLGAGFLNALSDWEGLVIAGRVVPADDLFVLLSYAVLMIAICVLTFRDGLKRTKSNQTRTGLFSYWLLPPVAEIPDLSPSRHSIPLVAWTGVVIGFLSGFLGMSGGLVLIPACIYLLGLRVHEAGTVTIVIVWLVSAQSTVLHAYHDHINLTLVVSLLISGTVGAAIGAQFAGGLSASQLKMGFGTLVLLAALIVLTRLCILIYHGSAAAVL
ncbi:MAG: sulfite exporter TauE/SafE family protein [Fuerstiella sp.]